MIRVLNSPWFTGILGVGIGGLLGVIGTWSHSQTQENNQENTQVPAIYTEVAAPYYQDSLETVQPSQEGDVVVDSESYALLERGFLVADLLAKKDYETLSTYVHPEKGVRFTPYSWVDFALDRVLTAEKIKYVEQDTTVYTWGIQDGSGFDLDLTTAEYFAQFVSPLDYTTAPCVATDTVLIHGNSLENIKEAYPDARFVDFSFHGMEPEFGGIDWSSLKLVFERVEDTFYLVGVVRGQWTI